MIITNFNIDYLWLKWHIVNPNFKHIQIETYTGKFTGSIIESGFIVYKQYKYDGKSIEEIINSLVQQLVYTYEINNLSWFRVKLFFYKDNDRISNSIRNLCKVSKRMKYEEKTFRRLS